MKLVWQPTNLLNCGSNSVERIVSMLEKSCRNEISVSASELVAEK